MSRIWSDAAYSPPETEWPYDDTPATTDGGPFPPGSKPAATPSTTAYHDAKGYTVVKGAELFALDTHAHDDRWIELYGANSSQSNAVRETTKARGSCGAMEVTRSHAWNRKEKACAKNRDRNQAAH